MARRSTHTLMEGARSDPGSRLRVVGYLRRSKERDNGYGLSDQEDRIRKWSEYVGAPLVAVCADDDVSGIVDPQERHGFGEALRLVRAGEADAIVVAKFDRLARSMAGFVNVLQLSQTEGWRLVCLDPEVDFGTAMGRAFAYMLITFAELEREQFIDRMQGGRRAKAKTGGYAGGFVVYGFRNEGGRLEVDEQTAPIVARVFELASRGESPGKIARTLGETPTPQGGRRWSRQAIHGILRNERYVGTIVSRRRFNAAQRALASRAKT